MTRTRPLTFGGNFRVTARVLINRYGKYARVFDFGNGRPQDNVLVTQHGWSGKLSLFVFVGTRSQSITCDRQAPLGRVFAFEVSVLNGKAAMYVDGALCAQGPVNAPPAVQRNGNLIGLSHWSHDSPLDGEVTSFELDTCGGVRQQNGNRNGNEIRPCCCACVKVSRLARYASSRGRDPGQHVRQGTAESHTLRDGYGWRRMGVLSYSLSLKCRNIGAWLAISGVCLSMQWKGKLKSKLLLRSFQPTPKSGQHPQHILARFWRAARTESGVPIFRCYCFVTSHVSHR